MASRHAEGPQEEGKVGRFRGCCRSFCCCSPVMRSAVVRSASTVDGIKDSLTETILVSCDPSTVKGERTMRDVCHSRFRAEGATAPSEPSNLHIFLWTLCTARGELMRSTRVLSGMVVRATRNYEGEV